MSGKKKSALNISKGIDIPSSINKNAAKKYISRQHDYGTAEELYRQLKSGDRIALSKAITLVESTLEKDQEKAQKLIEYCLSDNKDSIRIGITGVPGVGKSSFIESFGKMLTSQGLSLAVLAVDPSSSRTKGSILGDKTRMIELSSDKNAFIRPSPSAGSLGGVTQKTKESIIICEAVGFDVIIVETVGVGQSEIAVHNLVDFFLLLMLPGAGDILQGIKRGIIEMCDAIIINKADGDRIKHAEIASREYANALHMFPPTDSGWIPKTGICSAKDKTGIKETWNIIEEYIQFTKENGFFQKQREQQDISKLHDYLSEQLRSILLSNTKNRDLINRMEELIIQQKINPYKAAKEILDITLRGFKPS